VKFFIKKTLGLAPKVSKQITISTETHGHKDYGSWVVSKDSLNKDSNIFAVGIGRDIAFDLSIIKKYNAKIYEFDPTPEVVDWLETQDLPANFKYFPIALADSDGEVKFYKPTTEGYVSHSVNAKKEGQPYVKVPARRLISLMDKFNIRHLDLLKMDIEGFEYGVIDDIIASNCAINQLLIEFHHGMYGKKVSDTEQAIEKIVNKGYKIFHISDTGREFSFIKMASLN
jgi:FkbM family methyltransferase